MLFGVDGIQCNKGYLGLNIGQNLNGEPIAAEENKRSADGEQGVEGGTGSLQDYAETAGGESGGFRTAEQLEGWIDGDSCGAAQPVKR